MRNKKMLAMVLVLSMMFGLVACGNKEVKKVETTVKNQSEVVAKKKEETKQPENGEVNQPEEQPENVEVNQPEEQPEEQKTEQKTEQKAQQQSKTPQKESASNSQTTASAPVNNQPQSSTTTHEHTWELEINERYDLIKTYVNGCNGCGYPLFTITENGTQHIENLYFHPPCYSEKLGGDCTGGGFHNESYTSGYCVYCGGKVSYRQCMWTEMGKRCAKNEALGAYQKVYFDQNHFMYLDVCDCGENWIILEDETGKGIIGLKDYCTTCGVEK